MRNAYQTYLKCVNVEDNSAPQLFLSPEISIQFSKKFEDSAEK